MRLKKTALFGIAVALMPVLAHADFIVTNNTREPSTVQITTGSIHYCSASAPGGITWPGKQNTINAGQIRLLCIDSGATCEADIFPTASCGTPAQKIGHAALNVGTGQIIYAVSTSPTYKIAATATSVTIGY